MACELGIPVKDIALQGVPAQSIKGIVSRYKDQKSAQSQPRSGRLPKLNERDKRHIL